MVQSMVGSVTLFFVGVVTERGIAFELSPTAIVAVLYLSHRLGFRIRWMVLAVH